MVQQRQLWKMKNNNKKEMKWKEGDSHAIRGPLQQLGTPPNKHLTWQLAHPQSQVYYQNLSSLILLRLERKKKKNPIHLHGDAELDIGAGLVSELCFRS